MCERPYIHWSSGILRRNMSKGKTFSPCYRKANRMTCIRLFPRLVCPSSCFFPQSLAVLSVNRCFGFMVKKRNEKKYFVSLFVLRFSDTRLFRCFGIFFCNTWPIMKLRVSAKELNSCAKHLNYFQVLSDSRDIEIAFRLNLVNTQTSSSEPQKLLSPREGGGWHCHPTTNPSFCSFGIYKIWYSMPSFLFSPQTCQLLSEWGKLNFLHASLRCLHRFTISMPKVDSMYFHKNPSPVFYIL